MIMAALAIFQALIWVGVDVVKFLIDLSVKNILDRIITWSGGHASVWLAGFLFRCIAVTD
jgi:hypothetical protein